MIKSIVTPEKINVIKKNGEERKEKEDSIRSKRMPQLLLIYMLQFFLDLGSFSSAGNGPHFLIFHQTISK